MLHRPTEYKRDFVIQSPLSPSSKTFACGILTWTVSISLLNSSIRRLWRYWKCRSNCGNVFTLSPYCFEQHRGMLPQQQPRTTMDFFFFTVRWPPQVLLQHCSHRTTCFGIFRFLGYRSSSIVALKLVAFEKDCLFQNLETVESNTITPTNISKSPAVASCPYM